MKSSPPHKPPFGPLVTAEWLAEHLHDADLVIADVRWIHGQPGEAHRTFEESHIPGAIFLDVDNDLSDRRDPKRGRHPLPAPETFAETLTRVGIGSWSTVVTYDDRNGSLAARLWWMLKWIGGPPAAVLDGCLARWIAEGRRAASGEAVYRASKNPIVPRPDPGMILDREAVKRAAADGMLLLDARAPERHRGEEENIDFRAGHIPGAVNAPHADNMTDGEAPVFRTPEELRELYTNLGAADKLVIASCGSGVTACHDILALELAGFPGAKLYPGSWSEWIQHES